MVTAVLRESGCERGARCAGWTRGDPGTVREHFIEIALLNRAGKSNRLM